MARMAAVARGAAMRAAVTSAGTALVRAEAEVARAGGNSERGNETITTRLQQRRGTRRDFDAKDDYGTTTTMTMMTATTMTLTLSALMRLQLSFSARREGGGLQRQVSLSLSLSFCAYFVFLHSKTPEKP